MDRYDERTPVWDYSDNANFDDRSASDRSWGRGRAEQAARSYVAAEEGHRHRPDETRGRGRGRGARGGQDWSSDRHSQAHGRDERGGYDAGYRREPDNYFGDSDARRDMDAGAGSFWPSEFGYPAPRGYTPYGGRVSGRYGDEERGFFERAGDEVLSWFGDRDARRRREVDHRGRGPKNYARSDERIRDDANDRLTEDVWIDASEVEVMVADGEVTLSGTVEDRRAKRRAEDCVEAISGVKHVQNNLRYHSGVESPRIAD
jgi:osmotically-inducible protein OsmY